MKTPLLDIVRTRPLIGDGAMGTQLMLAGLEQGGCGDHGHHARLELVAPDACRAVTVSC